MNHLPFFDVPQDDIVLRMLEPVCLEGKISVSSVLMAQILLDIVDACGEPGRFFKQLKLATQYASSSFQFSQRADGRMSTGDVWWPDTGTPWLTKNYIAINSIEVPKWEWIKRLKLQNAPGGKAYAYFNAPAWMRNHWDRAGFKPIPDLQAKLHKLGMKMIRPSSEVDFWRRNNPLFSGAAMLNLLSLYHGAGLSLTNFHLSILVTAHLYNALRQLRLLELRWPLMEQIIAQQKRAIFADVIPVTIGDMVNRLNYRLDIDRSQKRVARAKRNSFKEAAGASILANLVEPDGTGDKALWHLEQQLETDCHSHVNKSQVRYNKLKRTPESFLSSAEATYAALVPELTTDYIRLTKHCYRLLDDFRRFWILENQIQGVADPGFDKFSSDGKSNGIGHLFLVLFALEESKTVRERGWYTHRPGDGELQGATGSLNNNPDDPRRHGVGLMTAAKVFRHYLSKRKSEFVFPVEFGDARAMDAIAEPTNRDDEELLNATTALFRRVASEAELDEVLAKNLYVVVDFFTDFDTTQEDMLTMMVMLSGKHRVPGLLELVRANRDDMPALARKHCKKQHVETFVFFKEGTELDPRGNTAVYGNDKEGLTAAIEQISALVKKVQETKPLS